MYLAFMNVHNGCGPPFAGGNATMPKGDWRYQAPAETVSLYNTTIRDTYKVTGAMYTELDRGVAEVVAALKDTGMWPNTLVVFVSDNGGPLSHTTNYPHRGGKWQVSAAVCTGFVVPPPPMYAHTPRGFGGRVLAAWLSGRVHDLPATV